MRFVGLSDQSDRQPSRHRKIRLNDHNGAQSGRCTFSMIAARLIVEALEHLNELSSSVDHSVASDLHVGAAILNASFAGIIMAVKINLEPDRMVDLHQHTAETRAELAARRHRIRGPQKCRCATGLPILRPK
nr:cyclodeaminase/cyclohydrolase family protein [Neorhizobium tomejilense]